MRALAKLIVGSHPAAPQAFEPARTVRNGRATYRLAIMSETALRDSPHGAGVIPLRGGR